MNVASSSLPRRGLPPAARLGLVIAALYLFALAVTLMGSSFKYLGKHAASGFLSWADNPVTGLLVGVLVTAIVQSSSTVTTMIVTAVAGGVIPLPVAVPMVMGANIGTTVTNTIVAFGSVLRTEEFRRSLQAATVHDFFNFLAVAILLPLEISGQATGLLATSDGRAVGLLGWLGDHIARLAPAAPTALGIDKGRSGIGFVFKGPVSWCQDSLAGLFSGGEHATAKALAKAAAADESWSMAQVWVGLAGALIGAAFLSACLVVISKNMRVLVLGRIEGAFGVRLLSRPVTCVLLGLVTTVLVQSSSITTSILVPVAAAGLLQLRQVFHVTLGANVGTTCTGLLAALFLVANGEPGATQGLGIACVHACFNLVGMAVILTIPGLRRLPISLAERFAEVCLRRRSHAIGYLLGAFFGLPGILLLLYRGLRALAG